MHIMNAKSEWKTNDSIIAVAKSDLHSHIEEKTPSHSY